MRFVLYKTADDDRSEYEPSEEEDVERERELKGLRDEFNGTANGAQGLISEATSSEYSGLGADLKKRNGVAVS